MTLSHSIRISSQRWMGRLLLQHSAQIRLLSYSRMLDMGGAPGAATSKNPVRVQNTSKNSKVQAVAFDFELLVQAIQEQGDEVSAKTTAQSSSTSTTTTPPPVNVDKVRELASLLNVDLEDGTISTKSKKSYEQDDLSALLGKDDNAKAKSKPKSTTGMPSSLEDIRSKYAKKLHKAGIEGGIAGVELANYEREESLKRGDAKGHLAARKVAMATSTQQSGTRWMALTGTGTLLSTLTHRSMKIALLPRPVNPNRPQARSPNERMEDLTRQLKDVVFDVLVDLPKTSDADSYSNMVDTTLKELALEPKVILFVSDQDAFLKHAKELGMMTCRIQPLNARRGNVTAHYTVKNVMEVEDVVNDMNGISFNAVLNM